MLNKHVLKDCYWENKEVSMCIFTASAKDSETGLVLGKVTVSATLDSYHDIKSEIESIANDALDKLINSK